MKFLCFQVITANKEDIANICELTYFDYSSISTEFEILPIPKDYSEKQINGENPVFHYPLKDESDLGKLIQEIKHKLREVGYYDTSKISISVINCQNLGIYKNQTI